MTLLNAADLAANPLRWSDEMYRIAGYEPGAFAVTAESALQITHEADRRLLGGAFAAALKTGGLYSNELRLVRPDGEERTVRATTQIFYDTATGEPLRLIGTALDITEQRRVEN